MHCGTWAYHLVFDITKVDGAVGMIVRFAVEGRENTVVYVLWSPIVSIMVDHNIDHEVLKSSQSIYQAKL